MHNLEKLKVWNLSMVLVVKIYQELTIIPTDQRFGLTSQIKRCTVSIPSNIAEGAGRNGDREFYHFLNSAYASSYELQTQVILLQRLNFISQNSSDSILSDLLEIQKMIFVFKENIKKKLN